jgi:hypothetical protein
MIERIVYFLKGVGMDEKEMNELRDLLSYLNGARWVKVSSKDFETLKVSGRVRFVDKQGKKHGFETGHDCFIATSKWFGKVIASFEHGIPLIRCVSENFKSEIKTLEVLIK